MFPDKEQPFDLGGNLTFSRKNERREIFMTFHAFFILFTPSKSSVRLHRNCGSSVSDRSLSLPSASNISGQLRTRQFCPPTRVALTLGIRLIRFYFFTSSFRVDDFTLLSFCLLCRNGSSL